MGRTGKTTGRLPAYAVYAAVVVCLLATMMASVAGYRSSVGMATKASTARTAVRYVATKLAQHDEPDNIHVKDVDNMSVLAMYEDGGRTCRLYWYGGSLWESYSWSDEPFDPESGIPVMDVPETDFAYDGILSMDVDGTVSYFRTRSGGGNHG